MQRERTGPLRNGNPRGNPNLAPRCGARARRTGCPCRAPAMRNGRCRMHGGKSTGPRTEEGRARIRAARTRHGRYSAEGRAFQRNVSDLLRRSRELLTLARQPGPVDAEALRHLAPPTPSPSSPHWGGDGRGEVGKPQTLRTPPRSTPTLSAPLGQSGSLVAGPTAIALSREHLLQREPPMQTQAPGAAPRATSTRRPILLARPTPLAP